MYYKTVVFKLLMKYSGIKIVINVNRNIFKTFSTIYSFSVQSKSGKIDMKSSVCSHLTPGIGVFFK